MCVLINEVSCNWSFPLGALEHSNDVLTKHSSTTTAQLGTSPTKIREGTLQGSCAQEQVACPTAWALFCTPLPLVTPLLKGWAATGASPSPPGPRRSVSNIAVTLLHVSLCFYSQKWKGGG